MQPKVSIIIPCYGVERYLDRCMKTVVNQTLKDIEIILVDDSSPDRVPEICDEWAKSDNRIKVIHKEKNEGLGFARNTGLDIAKGEYVAFVDSDDYVDITIYEQLYNASEHGIFDAVFCGLKQETINGSYLRINDFKDIKTFNKHELYKTALSFINKTDLCENERLFMSVWHSIYKRNIIESYHIRFYSEREILSEDLPFQVEFCLKANKIKFIPQHLYYYCLNKSSLTHKFAVNKFNAAFNLRTLLLDITKDYIEGRALIDSEFYSRIRNMLTNFIFSKSYSMKYKYKYIHKLCNNVIWKKLDMSNTKNKNWKYNKQFKLLKNNSPLCLITFCIFDKFFNKKNLFSLNSKISNIHFIGSNKMK